VAYFFGATLYIIIDSRYYRPIQGGSKVSLYCIIKKSYQNLPMRLIFRRITVSKQVL